MKTTFLLIVFALFFHSSNAQDIVGRWQANTPVVGEESDDNYQFFSDGKFCYNLEGYGKLSTVQKLGGTYSIVGNEIILTPTYYVVLMGGFIDRTGAEPGTAEWAFIGAKATTVKIEKIVKQRLSFKLYKSNGETIVEIDSNKFFKIQNNGVPHLVEV